jgi:protein CpxP
MKSIKILLASLLISASAFGQVDKTPEERATAQTEKMKNELALTPEQVEKVKIINLGIIQKNEGVRNSTMTAEEKKSAHKNIEDARDSMMKDALTAEQFQKYETLKAEKVQMRATKTNLKKANINKVEINPAPAKN